MGCLTSVTVTVVTMVFLGGDTGGCLTSVTIVTMMSLGGDTRLSNLWLCGFCYRYGPGRWNFGLSKMIDRCGGLESFSAVRQQC